jgi:hypothetical protein
MLNRTAWSVECVAALVGFKSTKNLYTALRVLTAASPVDLRHVSSAQLENLLATRLRLPSGSPGAYALDTTLFARTV